MCGSTMAAPRIKKRNYFYVTFISPFRSHMYTIYEKYIIIISGIKTQKDINYCGFFTPLPAASLQAPACVASKTRVPPGGCRPSPATTHQVSKYTHAPRTTQKTKKVKRKDIYFSLHLLKKRFVFPWGSPAGAKAGHRTRRRHPDSQHAS
jgi:hypothetical protein